MRLICPTVSPETGFLQWSLPPTLLAKVKKPRTFVLVGLLVASGLVFGPPQESSGQTATCKGSVGPGIPAPAQPVSGVPGFHASWNGQSGYPTLCAGERATSVVAYYNSGSLGWLQGRLGEAAYLGTWDAIPGQDRPSKLGGDGTNGSPNTGWPRYNRIAQQPAGYVAPGQVAWFTFTIQAPAIAGVYKLYLRPLIEGATWMEDYGVFWVVTVLNPDGTRPPPPPPEPPLGCREWPIEMGGMMSKLSLPSQLCLLPYEERPWTCGPPLAGCYVGKGIYRPGDITWTRNTVWIQSGLANDSELHVTAHESCHAHQHRVSLDVEGSGLYGGWERSQEAVEFGIAWDDFKKQFPQAYSLWGDRGQSLENAAEVCAGWYFPYGVSRTSSYPPLANWSQKWLPK